MKKAIDLRTVTLDIDVYRRLLDCAKTLGNYIDTGDVYRKTDKHAKKFNIALRDDDILMRQHKENSRLQRKAFVRRLHRLSSMGDNLHHIRTTEAGKNLRKPNVFFLKDGNILRPIVVLRLSKEFEDHLIVVRKNGTEEYTVHPKDILDSLSELRIGHNFVLEGFEENEL